MEKVRFMHICTEENGAVTLAYQRRGEDDDLWLFGAAFCAPTDTFNRALGRTIARGRLEKRVERENGNGKPLQMPGTTSRYGEEPHKSEEAVSEVLAQLRGKPYKGVINPKGIGPLWYSGFLYAVERGDVIRKKRG